jgi:hypothetical protein
MNYELNPRSHDVKPNIYTSWQNKAKERRRAAARSMVALSARR